MVPQPEGKGAGKCIGSASSRTRTPDGGAVESLNFSLRKVTKARGHFPNDEAALKRVYLAIRNMEKKWTRQPHFWNLALNQFAIMFEGRLPA